MNEETGLTDRQSLGSDYEFVAEDIVGRVSGLPFTYADFTDLPVGDVFAGAAQFDRHQTDARSIAVYANARIAATDRLSLTLGGRFTHERIDYESDLVAQNNGCDASLAALGLGGAPSALAADLEAAGAANLAASLACLVNITPLADGRVDGRRTENEFTWDAKASYALASNVTAFVGAARGYKSGGFNLDRAGGTLRGPWRSIRRAHRERRRRSGVRRRNGRQY